VPYRPGYELAAEQILEYIARNGLGPGDRLPTEKEMAAILGVSRPVARDAVRTVAALGRVTVRKGAGIFVASGTGSLSNAAGMHLFLPADLDQVFMLFELRRTLEREASRLAAARATPLEIKAIKAAVDHAFDAATAGDFVTFRVADDEFHNAVAMATRNMFFLSSIQAVIDLRRQVIAIGLSNSESGSMQLAAEQHAAVAHAIAAGEIDAAGEAMCAHVDITLDQFRREIKARIFANGSAPAQVSDRKGLR
jgi:DNA-binding FadR family transcriptional regulator